MHWVYSSWCAWWLLRRMRCQGAIPACREHEAALRPVLPLTTPRERLKLASASGAVLSLPSSGVSLVDGKGRPHVLVAATVIASLCSMITAGFARYFISVIDPVLILRAAIASLSNTVLTPTPSCFRPAHGMPRAATFSRHGLRAMTNSCCAFV